MTTQLHLSSVFPKPVNQELRCAPVPPRPKLRVYLENLGMTASELAEKAGVSYNTVIALTDPDRDGFKLSVLKKIAATLGCDPSDLIDVSKKSFILGSGNPDLDTSILDFLVAQRRSVIPEASQSDIDTTMSYLAPHFRFYSPHHKNWAHGVGDAPLSSEFIEQLQTGMDSQQWLRYNRFNKSQKPSTPTLSYVSQPRFFLPTGERAFSIHGTTTRMSIEAMDSGVKQGSFSYCSHCTITERWEDIGPNCPLKFNRITFVSISDNLDAGGTTE